MTAMGEQRSTQQRVPGSAYPRARGPAAVKPNSDDDARRADMLDARERSTLDGANRRRLWSASANGDEVRRIPTCIHRPEFELAECRSLTARACSNTRNAWR
jgi:hypothetical protein